MGIRTASYPLPGLYISGTPGDAGRGRAGEGLEDVGGALNVGIAERVDGVHGQRVERTHLTAARGRDTVCAAGGGDIYNNTTASPTAIVLSYYVHMFSRRPGAYTYTRQYTRNDVCVFSH